MNEKYQQPSLVAVIIGLDIDLKSKWYFRRGIRNLCPELLWDLWIENTTYILSYC